MDPWSIGIAVVGTAAFCYIVGWGCRYVGKG